MPRNLTEGFKWNPARITMLTDFWERGDTATQIGACMGVSRNTILAKARRMGLKRKNGDEALRFEKLVDCVANAPINSPVTIAGAAVRVGIPILRAKELWRELAQRLGVRDIARSPEAGDRLVRRIDA